MVRIPGFHCCDPGSVVGELRTCKPQLAWPKEKNQIVESGGKFSCHKCY